MSKDAVQSAVIRACVDVSLVEEKVDRQSSKKTAQIQSELRRREHAPSRNVPVFCLWFVLMRLYPHSKNALAVGLMIGDGQPVVTIRGVGIAQSSTQGGN